MGSDDPIAAMKERWSYIQPFLFPFLREEVNPLTPKLEQLIVVLDTIGLEAYLRAAPGGVGRPREDRRAIARAFIAKAVLGLPTTRALVERLHVDGALRRICGWERRAEIPSEATFSRAFSEFADSERSHERSVTWQHAQIAAVAGKLHFNDLLAKQLALRRDHDKLDRVRKHSRLFRPRRSPSSFQRRQWLPRSCPPYRTPVPEDRRICLRRCP